MRVNGTTNVRVNAIMKVRVNAMMNVRVWCVNAMKVRSNAVTEAVWYECEGKWHDEC